MSYTDIVDGILGIVIVIVIIKLLLWSFHGKKDNLLGKLVRSPLFSSKLYMIMFILSFTIFLTYHIALAKGLIDNELVPHFSNQQTKKLNKEINMNISNVRQFNTKYMKSVMAHRIKKIHDLRKPNFPLDKTRAKEYAEEFIKQGKQHNINPLLLQAIAESETKYVNPGKIKDGEFNDGAPKYSLGITQIQVRTAKWIINEMGVKQKLDHGYYESRVINPTADGIYLTGWLVDHLYKYYEGNINKVLYAYNAGIGNANRTSLKGTNYKYIQETLGAYQIMLNEVNAKK
jgi:hypothetical protein